MAKAKGPRKVRRLGKKHNLAVYDPQSERLHLPDDNKKPWWQFWR